MKEKEVFQKLKSRRTKLIYVVLTYLLLLLRSNKNFTKEKPTDFEEALQIANKSLSSTLNNKRNLKILRVIPVPKVGGFLPLILILAGIVKLGEILSGGLTVAKLIKYVVTAKDKKPTKLVAVGN